MTLGGRTCSGEESDFCLSDEEKNEEEKEFEDDFKTDFERWKEDPNLPIPRE
jgi:hypothetical protein